MPIITATGIRHFHVSESNTGCLPEAEPYVTISAADALDQLGHLLSEWADGRLHNDPDAAYACAVAEIYCTCRPGARSAEHHDAAAAIDAGRGICERLDLRVFELAPCDDPACLKFCPRPDCECPTAVGVDDEADRCWLCGATFVAWDASGWASRAAAAPSR